MEKKDAMKMTMGSTWKAKITPIRAALRAQRSEQKLAAHFGKLQHGVHAIADALKDQAEVRLQHQHREGELQAHAPSNKAEFDFLLVCREQPRDSQDYNEPQESR